MHRHLRAFLADDQGATAIEYALLASLMAVSAISAMSTVGGRLNNAFSAVLGALEDAPDMPQGIQKSQ